MPTEPAIPPGLAGVSARAWPFADLALAQRLERAEGSASRAFVEARASVQPDSRAAWCEIAGALAMFDGVDSPLTQTFGLGLLEPVTAEALAELEAFLTKRGADVFHEVSPLAGVELCATLARRGYLPVELTTVLYRPIEPVTAAQRGARGSGEVCVRRIEAGEVESWANVAARGWSDTPGLGDFMLEYGRINARSKGAHAFLAEADDQPIAAAALSIHDGVALFAGASTIPTGRRRGAQLALLDARLRYAAQHGCDLALMGAHPGSGSQRNAERNGFRVAYTRLKWRRPANTIDLS